MARKNNIRSIRFSDELAELIDRQVGDSFTEKFENLITRCVWELPQKEKQLERLDREIKEKREQLSQMSQTAQLLSRELSEMSRKTLELSNAITRAQKYTW